MSMEKGNLKKKSKIGNIIIITFVIITFLSIGYKYIKPQISSFMTELSLRESKMEVAKCVEQEDKTIGLEYGCAIQVASKLYDAEPEKAIELCLAYSPLETAYAGYSRSDAAIEADRNLASSTCKKQIEKFSQKGALAPIDSNTPKSKPEVIDATKTSDVCSEAPTETSIGRTVYPIASEYAHLEFLGQIFTAHNCGTERLSELYGVEGNMYTKGSVILLKKGPNPSLLNTLKSIGFECDSGRPSDEQCGLWNLKKPVDLEEIMKLEPYYEMFKSDDCYSCG